jgi:hypothetical protein
MIIYHGTAEHHLEAILKDGIMPRGKTRKNNWKKTVSSNPKAVYLTTTYALHFAASAVGNRREKMAVLKINTDDLNPFLFAPDEDFLEQCSRKQGVTDNDDVPCPAYDGTNMRARTIWFRERVLQHFQPTWKKSTEHLGTCCYHGTIPPSAIEKWALVPTASHVSFASDPMITTMNHAIMGSYYRALMQHVFGEGLTVPTELHEFDKQRIETIKQIPRDDVIVRSWSEGEGVAA